jgi:beta-aspartyl-peptidase (threonine type)
MVEDFLHLPRMAHVVTDTHFTRRDRLGRLVAFVAKTRATTADKAAIGLGVDEGASLIVDGAGLARLKGPAGTYAWLVQPAVRLVAARPAARLGGDPGHRHRA